MPTEADTCRTLITPNLQATGWENDPPSFAEQRSFTDGRIVVRGSRAEQRKLADYLNLQLSRVPASVTIAKRVYIQTEKNSLKGFSIRIK